MKKIIKLQYGGPSINWQLETDYLNNKINSWNLSGIQQPVSKPGGSISASTGRMASAALDQGVNYLSQNLFGNSEIGSNIGRVFSSTASSAGNTMINNLVKGNTLTQGLGTNVNSSLAGVGAGFVGNYMGKGITSAMGDSRLGRAVGSGIATGVGMAGGTVASTAIQTASAINTANKALKAAKATGDAAKIAKATEDVNKIGSVGSNLSKLVNTSNLVGLGGAVLGSALGAATGPSKEYGGKYGNITQTMDTAYDLVTAGIGFVPGVGTAVSGIMAFNKGLSNVFGSTDGMTKQDAILGSAFMPAPVKWLNMAGAKTTGTFGNQSWQNTQKTNDFMGNAFGNLGDKFDKAREEAGKTYGTFSRGAYNKAQNNLNFANEAFGKVLAMADQNEIQNIRSQYMSSINNQRYAQNIQGGFTPLARGKQGMKIFNNSINPAVSMRLLSGAALIDNKQMILSKCSEIN